MSTLINLVHNLFTIVTIVAAKLEPYFVIHSSTWPLNLTEPASNGLDYLLKSYWNNVYTVQVFRDGYKKFAVNFHLAKQSK
jgi:hypothetical protein